MLNYQLYMYIQHKYYIPVITVPSVLVMFWIEWTIHWKVVVPLIERTVSERALGVVGLFSRYSLLRPSSVNDVPLIIHITGSRVSLWYPQLMVTSLPLHTIVFSGGLVTVTTGKPIHLIIGKQTMYVPINKYCIAGMFWGINFFKDQQFSFKKFVRGCVLGRLYYNAHHSINHSVVTG